MLAKKTVKNQITLPKAIVDKLPQADYFDVSIRGQEIVLRPVVKRGAGVRLESVRSKMKALRLTEKDLDAAIRWASSPW